MMKTKMLAGGFNCGRRMSKGECPRETTKLELSMSNRDKRLKINNSKLSKLCNNDTSYNVYIPRIPEREKEVCVPRKAVKERIESPKLGERYKPSKNHTSISFLKSLISIAL